MTTNSTTSATPKLMRPWQAFFVSVGIAVSFVGCSPDKRSSTEQMERDAVAAFRSTPDKIIRAQGCSTEPTVVKMTDGTFVAEKFTHDEPQWDYRPTTSGAFPFDAIMGFEIHRWITKPYPTQEAAAEAAKAFGNFFSIPVDTTSDRLFYRPDLSVPDQPEIVAEMKFDAANKVWITNSTVFAKPDDYRELREKWSKQHPLADVSEKPKDKEPSH